MIWFGKKLAGRTAVKPRKVWRDRMTLGLVFTWLSMAVVLTTSSVVGREFVESYGGEVRLLSEVPNVSTTRIVTQIRTLSDAA